ncbi:hypothetical protein SASPL_129769 [Salvia splendens]|uniref:J domain-containing protein n=1 Tax=Salvia splendens TaxID=180675 RepID=A0A8X8XDQ1_SALSN|nr:hypothetical protein SASPL_129769 [Salvia splendens]
MSVRAEVAVDRRSLYEVLRVKRNASPVEIKTAYHTLAKLHHPDARARLTESSIAMSADGGHFIEIHNAYATLSDPNARAELGDSTSFEPAIPKQFAMSWYVYDSYHRCFDDPRDNKYTFERRRKALHSQPAPSENRERIELARFCLIMN